MCNWELLNSVVKYRHSVHSCIMFISQRKKNYFFCPVNFESVVTLERKFFKYIFLPAGSYMHDNSKKKMVTRIQQFLKVWLLFQREIF